MEAMAVLKNEFPSMRRSVALYAYDFELLNCTRKAVELYLFHCPDPQYCRWPNQLMLLHYRASENGSLWREQDKTCTVRRSCTVP